MGPIVLTVDGLEGDESRHRARRRRRAIPARIVDIEGAEGRQVFGVRVVAECLGLVRVSRNTGRLKHPIEGAGESRHHGPAQCLAHAGMASDARACIVDHAEVGGIDELQPREAALVVLHAAVPEVGIAIRGPLRLIEARLHHFCRHRYVSLGPGETALGVLRIEAGAPVAVDAKQRKPRVGVLDADRVGLCCEAVARDTGEIVVRRLTGRGIVAALAAIPGEGALSVVDAYTGWWITVTTGDGKLRLGPAQRLVAGAAARAGIGAGGSDVEVRTSV